MAKIQTGNFGQRTAGVQQVGDTSQVGDAFARLGATIAGIGEEQQMRRHAVARGKASNAVLDNRIAIDAKVDEIGERIRSGQLNYEEARRTFDEEIGELKPGAIEYLDPVAAEGLTHGIKQNALTGGNAIERLVAQARRQDLQSQFTSGLDNLGKLAGAPDADIADINAKAEQFVPLAIAGGVPKDQVDGALQNFKDRNWYNQATQRAMTYRNDMAGLKLLAQDLTAADGYYSGKLDTDKRNSILRGVQADQDRLINHAETQQLRAEARADRAIAQIDRQIASGVPATPQMWADWSNQVKGTPQAAEFRERVKSEQVVQDVLRQPIEVQESYVQQQEAQLLQQGGTLQQAANLGRLKEAVKRNVTLMQETPLLFQQNRTGAEVEPIDFVGMGTEEGATAIQENLRDRVLTLDAMRRQYGDRVPMRPLLPQEAKQLSAALEASSGRQAADVFATLRQAVGDDATFKGMMRQIAPDSPVKAEAALLAAKQRSMTLERNWIADDVVASSRDVASTILAGEEILNRSRAAKAGDGKPDKGLFMPGDTDLQTKFSDEVGDAFAGRPGAADVAFQVVKSYYAGKAAQTGKIAKNEQDVDANLVREAITASLGSVIDYNGQGKVLAPWGMSEDQFGDNVREALEIEARASKNPDAFRLRSGLLGLQQAGGSTYYLTNGRGYVTDDTGNPIIIDAEKPGRTRRGGVITR